MALAAVGHHRVLGRLLPESFSRLQIDSEKGGIVFTERLSRNNSKHPVASPFTILERLRSSSQPVSQTIPALPIRRAPTQSVEAGSRDGAPAGQTLAAGLIKSESSRVCRLEEAGPPRAIRRAQIGLRILP